MLRIGAIVHRDPRTKIDTVANPITRLRDRKRISKLDYPRLIPSCVNILVQTREWWSRFPLRGKYSLLIREADDEREADARGYPFYGGRKTKIKNFFHRVPTTRIEQFDKSSPVNVYIKRTNRLFIIIRITWKKSWSAIRFFDTNRKSWTFYLNNWVNEWFEVTGQIKDDYSRKKFGRFSVGRDLHSIFAKFS